MTLKLFDGGFVTYQQNVCKILYMGETTNITLELNGGAVQGYFWYGKTRFNCLFKVEYFEEEFHKQLDNIIQLLEGADVRLDENPNFTILPW